MTDDNASTDPDITSTEAIVEAFARLRTRRRRARGGRTHGDHFRSAGPKGMFKEHGHGHRPHDPGAHKSATLDDEARLARGLGGPPAIVRMVEALAKSESPMSVNELASAIEVDQPRASRLVQQGVTRDLLIRQADPDDARRTRIALTERGEHFARGLRTNQRAALATALKSFTSDERAEFARLLGKLADGWPT